MKKEYSKDILDEIGAKFSQASVKIHAPRRTYIRVPRDDVHALAEFLHKEKGCRLAIATGIDKRDGMEIIYHFSHDPSGTFYSIKTLVPKDDLKMNTLADFMPAANWIEREIHELLGIDFVGHPNLIPLLTAEAWSEDLHPLRRDYANEHEELKLDKAKEDR